MGQAAAARALQLACAAVLLITPAGCGIARRTAIGSMVPILQKTVEEVYRDQDVETVAAGMPGNLLLLRGLSASDPGRRDLSVLTTQLYFYYGIGFIEDVDPEHASLVYEQGLALGRSALARESWWRPDGSLEDFQRGLEKADEDDVPLLFWTLANWSAWIRGNLDRPDVLAQLPTAEAALERIRQLDATYFHGMPHLLLGTLEASKPVLLGGDPEKARGHFEEALRLSDRKLLIFQVLYAQTYCRQQLDEQGFVQALEEVLQAPQDLAPDYRLLNEVARRKASLLMERKDELF
jgi:tetratricopeptide (TPR) repeat protein